MHIHVYIYIHIHIYIDTSIYRQVNHWRGHSEFFFFKTTSPGAFPDSGRVQVQNSSWKKMEDLPLKILSSCWVPCYLDVHPSYKVGKHTVAQLYTGYTPVKQKVLNHRLPLMQPTQRSFIFHYYCYHDCYYHRDCYCHYCCYHQNDLTISETYQKHFITIF